MLHQSGLTFGWCPDIPDFRDYRDATCNSNCPPSIDLREIDVDLIEFELSGVHASCSQSILAMVDWQSRVYEGNRLDASVSFLHNLTVRTFGGGGLQGVSLRSSLKALSRFGSPPERMWPSAHECFFVQPRSPELFGFTRRFRSIQFLRLDSWFNSAHSHVSSIQQWISRGLPCLIGFSVPTTLRNDLPFVPLDSNRGGTVGGTACIVMGYDDDVSLPFRIVHPLVRERSRRQGALLIKTSWNGVWGDRGYGWLPYAFIECQFASDAWALRLSPSAV